MCVSLCFLRLVVQNPAVFKVMFGPAEEPEDGDGDDRAAGRSGGSSRSLLNVVQRRFTAPATVTGPDGVSIPLPESEDGSGFMMFVSAVREGVPAPGYKDDGIIVYNIGIASCFVLRASCFVLRSSFSFFAA
jgi:hypothetical protein